MNNKISARKQPLFVEVIMVATYLVRGHIIVEVPGRYASDKLNSAPEEITLPEPRLLESFFTSPCKHECSIIKQMRSGKQTFEVLNALFHTGEASSREGICMLVWFGLISLSCGYSSKGYSN